MFAEDVACGGEPGTVGGPEPNAAGLGRVLLRGLRELQASHAQTDGKVAFGVEDRGLLGDDGRPSGAQDHGDEMGAGDPESIGICCELLPQFCGYASVDSGECVCTDSVCSHGRIIPPGAGTRARPHRTVSRE
jgi:hypothetical protein